MSKKIALVAAFSAVALVAVAIAPKLAEALANPSSQYCAQQGGTSNTMTRGDGGQYSVCNFPDGSFCEEWAFFYGDCKKGTKVTPNNSATRYCVANGGTVHSETSGSLVQYMCEFNDGSECDVWAFYQNQCRKGDNKQAPIGGNTYNPASAYCTQHNGKLIMVNQPTGTIGICQFPDGTQCEEWAFYNGDCEDTKPVIGGGGENPASVFCANHGGTSQIEGSTGYCVFDNGAKCEEWAYYYGDCQKPVMTASQYCMNQKGWIAKQRRNDGQGSELLCVLPNGQWCEINAYFSSQGNTCTRN